MALLDILLGEEKNFYSKIKGYARSLEVYDDVKVSFPAVYYDWTPDMCVPREAIVIKIGGGNSATVHHFGLHGDETQPLEAVIPLVERLMESSSDEVAHYVVLGNPSGVYAQSRNCVNDYFDYNPNRGWDETPKAMQRSLLEVIMGIYENHEELVFVDNHSTPERKPYAIAHGKNLQGWLDSYGIPQRSVAAQTLVSRLYDEGIESAILEVSRKNRKGPEWVTRVNLSLAEGYF